MNLRKRIRWFLDHQDDRPMKVHVRGVWADHNDGSGSQFGSPALSLAFGPVGDGSGDNMCIFTFQADDVPDVPFSHVQDR
jgi:hypothetical protein